MIKSRTLSFLTLSLGIPNGELRVYISLIKFQYNKGIMQYTAKNLMSNHKKSKSIKENNWITNFITIKACFAKTKNLPNPQQEGFGNLTLWENQQCYIDLHQGVKSRNSE